MINEYVDTEELEAIAMCFDNIRRVRTDNRFPSNNDNALGDQFDQELNNFMNSLTESVEDKTNSEFDKKKVAIEGKRFMMTLLQDKMAEYLKFKDPQVHTIFSDIAIQYDTLVDQSLQLAD